MPNPNPTCIHSTNICLDINPPLLHIFIYHYAPERRPIFTVQSTFNRRLALWLTSWAVVCLYSMGYGVSAIAAADIRLDNYLVILCYFANKQVV